MSYNSYKTIDFAYVCIYNSGIKIIQLKLHIYYQIFFLINDA